VNTHEVDRAIKRVNFKNRARSILRSGPLVILAAVFGFYLGYSVIVGAGR